MRCGLTERQWEFVYELFCFGYTYKDLAEWIGCSAENIRYHFHRLGSRASPNDLEPLSAYNRKLYRLGGDTDARP